MGIVLQIAVPVLTLVLGTLLGSWATRRRERQHWVESNVSKPLFNEVSDITKTGGIKLGHQFKSFAESLGAFARLKLGDKKLIGQVDEYVFRVEAWRDVATRDEQQRSKPDSELVRAVQEAIPERLRATDSPGHGEIRGLLFRRTNGGMSYIEVDRFLSLYWEPLHSGKRGPDLAKAVVEAAKQTGQEEFMRLWPSQYPEFFEALGDVFASRFGETLIPQLKAARDQVVSQAAQLERTLKRRME